MHVLQLLPVLNVQGLHLIVGVKVVDLNNDVLYKPQLIQRFRELTSTYHVLPSLTLKTTPFPLWKIANMAGDPVHAPRALDVPESDGEEYNVYVLHVQNRHAQDTLKIHLVCQVRHYSEIVTCIRVVLVPAYARNLVYLPFH